MKIKSWRVGILVILLASILFGLMLPTTNVSASNGKEQNRISAADTWGSGCWYIVRPGDNLFRIGLRYGVSYWYLAHLNGLWNPNRIYAGMKLRVPCVPPPPPPPPPPCNEPARYVVKPGDNLFRIALRYGTTVDAIRDANNLWGKVLRPGMTLIIPCPLPQNDVGKTPAAPPPPPPPPPNQGPTTTPPTTAPPTNGTAPLPPEPSAQIVLGAQAIDPNAATIQVGQSVVWINSSENIYTLVSGLPGQPNDVFNSGPLPAGATFIFTFAAPGSYSYYVNENPTLIGQVVVNP